MFSHELLKIGHGVTGQLGEDHRLVVKPKVLATNAGSFPARHCQEESGEIQALRNYEDTPSRDFWSNFPSAPLPEKVISLINVVKLQEIIHSSSKNLLVSQKH